MPEGQDVNDAVDKFGAYYQAALDSGADPLILMLFVLILVGLFVLAIWIVVNYRIQVKRLQSGYSPEPGERRADMSGAVAGSSIDVVQWSQQFMKETLTPLMTMFNNHTVAIQNLADSIAIKEKREETTTREHKSSHQFFTEKTEALGGVLNAVKEKVEENRRLYISLMEGTENLMKTGIMLLDSELKMVGWNKIGQIIAGKKGEVSKDYLGKSLLELGVFHTKCLGTNTSLKTFISNTRERKSPGFDVLELSFSEVEKGEWNWYFLIVLPFSENNLLLLFDIGDMTRAFLPDREAQKEVEPEAVAQPSVPALVKLRETAKAADKTASVLTEVVKLVPDKDKIVEKEDDGDGKTD